MAFDSVEPIDEKLINSENWRLYHLLELEQPVTARQVQWTFRKVTLRHHFYQAYRVLSSSDRKSLYDILGEDVVGFILSGSWGPLIACLGARKTIALYCTSMLFLTSLLILFFVFIGLRVDQVIMWPWLFVLIPLLVFVFSILVITLVALITNIISKVPREEGLTFLDRIPPIGNFLAALCYSIFCIFIVIQFQDDLTISQKEYLNFFYVLIVGDVLYYLSSLLWRWPHYIRLQMEVDTNRANPVLCYGFFILAFVHIALSAAQWVLIEQKIDGKTSASWYLVFIPVALRAAFRVIEAFMHSMVKRTIGIRTAVGVAFDTIGSFFVNGSLIASLYFVAVRITRGPEVYPIVYSLIPVYVILAYVFIALIITAIYLSIRNKRNEEQEDLRNLRWTPEGLTTPGGGHTFLFDDPSKAADWGELDDDVPSDLFPDHMDQDSYDDFSPSKGGDVRTPPRVTAPYGVTAPPLEDVPARRHWPDSQMSAGSQGTQRTPRSPNNNNNRKSGSMPRTTTGTRSGVSSEGDSSGKTERPPRYRDPYEPLTDAAPRRYSPSLSDDDMEGYTMHSDEEDYGDYEEGEDNLETETRVSSSATSSPIFSSGNVSPRR